MSQRDIKYPRLGEEIDRLVRSLAAVKGWKMAVAMAHISKIINYSPDTIHRWRQGKMRPSFEALEVLVKIGKEDANLPRSWGETLLSTARYANHSSLLNKLWGPKETRSIPCNLPSRDRMHLVGRHSEINRLLQFLSPDHAAHIITVDGIGGVGKTALVLEVAYRCWRKSKGEEIATSIPRFDAIIFVSAKQQYLTSDGVISINDAKKLYEILLVKLLLPWKGLILHPP